MVYPGNSPGLVQNAIFSNQPVATAPFDESHIDPSLVSRLL